MRGVALDEVARRPGDGGWAVAARIVNAFGMVEVGTGIALAASGPDARRSVRVNHAPARSSEALLEHLRVLWLTPAMDGLFVGPASERRRFLDRAVLAIDRKHGTRFNAFEKAMRSRNRLLADPSPDDALARRDRDRDGRTRDRHLRGAPRMAGENRRADRRGRAERALSERRDHPLRRPRGGSCRPRLDRGRGPLPPPPRAPSAGATPPPAGRSPARI